MSSLEGGTPLDKGKPDTQLTDWDRRVFESMAKALWLPNEFKDYMVQYLALNQPPVPVGQLVGFDRASASALVSKTADQSLLTATFTEIAFDSEIADPVGMHNTVTNNGRLTCVLDGLYLPYAFVAYAANAAGERAARVLLNGGATYTAGFFLATAPTNQFQYSASFPPVRLVEGDYLTIQGWQSSGGALNALSTCQFGMTRISAY